MKPLPPIFADRPDIARAAFNAAANPDRHRRDNRPVIVGKGLPTYQSVRVRVRRTVVRSGRSASRCRRCRDALMKPLPPIFANRPDIAREAFNAAANPDRHRRDNRPAIVGEGLPTYQSVSAPLQRTAVRFCRSASRCRRCRDGSAEPISPNFASRLSAVRAGERRKAIHKSGRKGLGARK